PTLYTTTGSPERGYLSVLTTSDNDTVNTIIYRCTATISSYSSFSDITVYLLKAIASSTATISVTNTASSITTTSLISPFTSRGETLIPCCPMTYCSTLCYHYYRVNFCCHTYIHCGWPRDNYIHR
ncbi:hypothetical protein GBAR_LOCUS23235, partial [Geodia barretti]